MFILGREPPLDVYNMYKVIKHDYIHKSHVIKFLVLSEVVNK
jgi:hypothetical protein